MDAIREGSLAIRVGIGKDTTYTSNKEVLFP
jgi:hypothetical protein